MKDTGLYSSRLIKNYVEYLKEHHPEVNLAALLNYAGITSYQLEDGGHWFSQKQVDLFHDGIEQQTNDPNIPKNVGRNAPFSKAAGTVSQYALGLITPSVAYSVLGKLYHFFSRACTINIKNLKSNKVEIVLTPNPGVEEKSFQCDNRMGTFEAIAKLFTTKFADIEHPTCVHKGGNCCRYIISWENTPSLTWKKIRNYIALSAFVVCPALFYLLHDKPWVWLVPVLLYLIFVLILFLYAEYIEKKELVLTLKSQGKLADNLLDEINIRYNNAMLVQEIGQATSMILDSEQLLKLVMDAMEKRLDFDRGMIMLANQAKNRLIYSAGYGYNPEHEEYLMGIEFHLDKSHSKGPLVESFRLQKPILIDNINEIENDLSKKSQEFAKMMGAQSFICVPIIFEKKSMGTLMVDNIRSKRHLKQSDVSLLMGIATQISISMNNAASYQKVLESEERFRSLSENAPDIIYRLDTNGLFTYVNPAWERILGHNTDEIMGRYFIDFVKKEDVKDYIQLFKQVTDEKHTVRDRIGTILHKNGAERVFNISGAPNLDLKGNVTGIVGIFKDISEQQKLESQLLHAQKMEAIGTLAGGIAHDFNNLLTGIQGHASLMFLEINVSHPFYEKLKGIEDQVRSGAELTKQLLGFARGGKYEVTVVDLNEIINKTSAMFGRTKKEISIHRKNERNLWSVEVDRGQIEQVLLNMYVNSWQAMPGGGDLYLETSNNILDDDYVKPFSVKPGRYVTVSITDTGIGMDEKTIERIFDPFFTTKEIGRGTGLGLASAYGIIKSHNGFINVQSEKGNGTTFTVYIPASDKKVMHIERVSDDLVRGDGNILLVDDEDVILDVGKEILEVLGYKVFVAKSGHEAIRVLSEMREEIDLVILDMIMPGMSGGETFDAIKLINSNIKVVLSSGYSLDARRTKKLDRSYDGFIQKPYDMITLSQKVKSVLDKKPQ
ncbi:MAG: PAS domain S-box protein [Syntrophaceae bacterium]